VVIFFGAIFATLLTLFLVPIFYNLLARFTKSPQTRSRALEAYDAQEAAQPAE
jgi:multidrug efflux pump